MDGPSAFFRVFDSAFFVPGALVSGSLWFHWGLSGSFRCTLEKQETVGAVAVGVAMLAITYGIGLVIHGLARPLHAKLPEWIRGKRQDVGRHPAWFDRLERSRFEALLEYFWYTRAVCHNLAVAAPLALLLVIFAPTATGAPCGAVSPTCSWLLLMLAPVLFVVFMRLASEYDRALAPVKPVAGAPSPPAAVAHPEVG